MKRPVLSSFTLLALMLVIESSVAQSTALAAQNKRSCQCGTALQRRTRSTAARSRRTAPPRSASAAQPGGAINAAVVGPVLATHTLPQNQYFRLRMNQTLNSETSRMSDRFRATVVTPVYADGVEVVPAGSIVEGRVTSVAPARSRGREGQLAVAFDSLVLPDGTRVVIDGSLTELQDDRSAEVDAENEVSGRSSDDRNIAYVGGGGAGGAVLGGVIGGAKGAAIGAAIGAGAGVAGVFLTKGHEAEIRSGTEIGMVTTQPINFTVRSDRQ